VADKPSEQAAGEILYENFLVQVMYSKSYGEERGMGERQVENASGRKPLLRRTWTGGPTACRIDRLHGSVRAPVN
jgi:hypothetical protein